MVLCLRSRTLKKWNHARWNHAKTAMQLCTQRPLVFVASGRHRNSGGRGDVKSGLRASQVFLIPMLTETVCFMLPLLSTTSLDPCRALVSRRLIPSATESSLSAVGVGSASDGVQNIASDVLLQRFMYYADGWSHDVGCFRKLSGSRRRIWCVILGRYGSILLCQLRRLSIQACRTRASVCFRS